MDILEEKDNLPFDEKKNKAIAYLKMQADILSAKNNRQTAVNDEAGRQIKDRFWKDGDITKSTPHVHIRAVQDADKEKFLELQTETCIAKSMLKEEASRRLFEKLGAVPYGIAEYLLHKEEDIIRCEEENLSKIDDRLIQPAEKFAVEPRKLLSHVLEYELRWQNHRIDND